eukprot:13533924-Alexandrium_andersonii.AAC.1
MELTEFTARKHVPFFKTPVMHCIVAGGVKQHQRQQHDAQRAEQHVGDDEGKLAARIGAQR